MAAAYRRVAEAGFEGLRLRQVALDAGIDHSTLHHHFATKQELVEAVARHAVEQFFPTGPRDGGGLRAHLDALHQLMVQRPELLTVSAELDLRARRDPAVRALLDAFEAGWRATIVAALGPGVPDRAGAAELVIAAVKGVRLTPELADGVFARLHTYLEEAGR